MYIVDLTTENNEDAKKRKEAKYAQKESTLQPITKPKSKLDKELQEWEVESAKGGANDGGGWEEKEKMEPEYKREEQVQKGTGLYNMID